jgi:Arm DNA-binding domain/Phage integrase family/Phage integrase central domain
MPMHAKLTKAFVAKAKAVAGAERSIWWDENMESFGLMVTAAGHRSFIVQYRAAGRSRRYTIKANQSLAKARKQAKSVLGSVAEGRDPVFEKREQRKRKAEEANTLKAIAEEYLRREEQKKELRSIGERRRIFERNIYPKLGSRQIDSIRRSEIVRLLDRIEDDSGASMADHVLAVLRRLMSWHASRSDDFRSPITRDMARTRPKERARERVLSDDELRAVWKAAGTFPGPYGHLVKFILLTATRRREAANMRRQEVTGSEWLIPAARHKSKGEFLLPLSKATCEVLATIPAIGTKGWVFTTDGERPIAGFSKFKRQFDNHVLALLREHDPNAKPLSRWTTHDLRRTGRSLLSRAGVTPDHAERCLGHVIGGVRGTYDRHSFEREKAQAFEALAALVARILDSNVLPLLRTG